MQIIIPIQIIFLYKKYFKPLWHNMERILSNFLYDII